MLRACATAAVVRRVSGGIADLQIERGLGFLGDGGRGAVLVALVAEEAAALFAASAAGVAGGTAVDGGRLVVDFFAGGLGLVWLDGEDGIGAAVAFEGVDDADAVANGLSLGTLASVGVAASRILLRADGALDGESAVVADG